MTPLLRAVLVLLVVGRVAYGSAVRALDGLGHPVAWWAVLKLPSHVQSFASDVVPTPCDCPPPNCSNVATAGWPALEARASGLCYLYADANHPEFRHFRDVGFDCLGQGGNDPVSQTLKQMHEGGDAGPYWALFNDQLNGIAAAFQPASDPSGQLQPDTSEDRRVCGGDDLFSAHAKGAVAFRDDGSGGYFLQTSTPNFPDPTLNESLVRLGCQADNNVQFAQHMLALSLEDSEMRALGQELQLARLCSGNFFRNESLHDLLASASLYSDGPSQKNSSASAFYHALLNPELPMQKPSDPMKSELRLKLSRSLNTAEQKSLEHATGQLNKSRVYEPLLDNKHFADLASGIDDDLFANVGPRSDENEVLVLVKSPRAAVPPWALVAETLDSDMSVASWWDGSYGIPTICAGDVFSGTPNEFCLNDPRTGVQLDADGAAPYNIENLLQASWPLGNDSARFTWQLVGGRVADGNHAKWGLTTPRQGPTNASAYATFGDLNMEGYPCSKACNGSQAGRGGSFFSLQRNELHASLTRLVSRACHCRPPTSQRSLPAFEELRMCHRGCVKKLEQRLAVEELPELGSGATSFWDR